METSDSHKRLKKSPQALDYLANKDGPLWRWVKNKQPNADCQIKISADHSRSLIVFFAGKYSQIE